MLGQEPLIRLICNREWAVGLFFFRLSSVRVFSPAGFGAGTEEEGGAHLGVRFHILPCSVSQNVGVKMI